MLLYDPSAGEAALLEKLAMGAGASMQLVALRDPEACANAAAQQLLARAQEVDDQARRSVAAAVEAVLAKEACISAWCLCF